MMRILQSAVFTLAVLFTAGAVLAQNEAPGGAPKEQGGGQGERGGGRGGFGFGGRGGGGGIAGLLRMEEVRTELKVTDDQNTKVRAAGEEVRNGLQPPDVDFASLQDASDEERQAARTKMQEYMAKVDKEMRAKLAGILDETQMKRLQGLWAQRAGAVEALNNEEIGKELKLTDEQKTSLKTQLDEQRAQMRGGFGGGRGRGEAGGGGGGGGGGFRERMEQARKASDDKAMAVLSDEQKAQFDTIKGAKFDFPPPQFGGGRGGEGGGGGRRGRNAL